MHVLLQTHSLSLTDHFSTDQHADTDAPAKSQTDVFLRPVSKFRHLESLLPGRTIQQEQHGPTYQMVQQLPVRLVSRNAACAFLLLLRTRERCQSSVCPIEILGTCETYW